MEMAKATKAAIRGRMEHPTNDAVLNKANALRPMRATRARCVLAKANSDTLASGPFGLETSSSCPSIFGGVVAAFSGVRDARYAEALL